MEMDFFEESVDSFIDKPHKKRRKNNNIKIIKYYLYLIISPLLIFSLIFLIYKIVIFTSNNKTNVIIPKPKPNPKPDPEPIKPKDDDIIIPKENEKKESNKKENEEKEEKNQDLKVLLRNEFIRKPLTDNRIYEIIKLNNGINSVIISDINATRSGMIVGINYEGYSNLLFKAIQRVIYNNTKEGINFKNVIKRYYGNIKIYSNKGINYFYFDSDSENFYECIKSLYNMLHEINFTSQIYNDILNEINNLKNNNEIIDPFYEAIEVSDYIIFDLNKDNLNLNLDSLKNIFINIYNNPSKISISVISNQNINNIKTILNSTWSKLKKININDKVISKYNVTKDKLRKDIYYKSKFNSDFHHVLYLCNEENLNELDSMSLYYFIAYLFNYHGKDSLGDNLKSDRYIENLYVNINKLSINSPYYLLISVKLTTKGFNNINYINQLIYEYLMVLSKQNNYTQLFNDFTIINEQKFNFSTISKYSSFLERISEQLLILNYNKNTVTQKQLSNLIFNPFNTGEYNYMKLKKIFNYMIDTENLSYITITDENLFQNLTKTHINYNHMEIYYYTFEKSYLTALKKNITNKLITNPEDFKIREKNPYISKINYLNIIYEEEYHFDNFESTLYEKWKNFAIYYRYDKLYSIPRCETFLYFNYFNEKKKLSDILQIIIYNHLKNLIEFNFEEAIESGNFISIHFLRDEGFIIKISSYYDQIYRMIFNLVQMLIDKNNFFTLYNQDYNGIKYENQNEKYFDYMRTFAIKKGKNIQEVIITKEINSLYKPLFLVDFQSSLLSNVYIKSLIYGIFDNNIIDYIKDIFDQKLKNHVNLKDIDKKPNENNIKINNAFNENKCVIYVYNHTFWNDDLHYMIISIKIGDKNIINEIYADLIVLIWKENFELKTKIEKIHYGNSTFIKLTKSDFVKIPSDLVEETINFEMRKILGFINDIEKDDFYYYIGKLKLDLKKVMNIKEKSSKAFENILFYYPLNIKDKNYIELLNNINLIEFQKNSKKILRNNLMIIFEYFKIGTITKSDKQIHHFEILNNICLLTNLFKL